MHGIIHRSLKQYVIDRASDDAWETVTDVVDVDDKMYLPVTDYPDEEIAVILEGVSDLTGHSLQAVQRDFGAYFAPQMLDTFQAMIGNDWGGLDVIAGLEVIYPEVVRKKGDPDDVEVDTHRPDEDTVVVEYTSARDLGYLVEGIVRGIVNEYDLSVNIDTQEANGADDPDYRITVERM